MQEISSSSLRSRLEISAKPGLALANSTAQTFRFSPRQRYPEPPMLIPVPRFARCRTDSSAVEQGGSGMRRNGWRITRMASPASVVVRCVAALSAIA